MGSTEGKGRPLSPSQYMGGFGSFGWDKPKGRNGIAGAGAGGLVPSTVPLVRLGHGCDPVLLSDDQYLHAGRGIPGLSGHMIAAAVECAGGRKIQVMSMAELVTRVLVLQYPDIQERWYADVYFASGRGDFLIDTGATTSMITYKFYNSLSNPPPILPSDVRIKVADGRRIHCRGIVVTPMQLGGRWYAHRLLVMDELTGQEDGILGMDFMYIHDCIMNCRNGKVFLDDGEAVMWAKKEGDVLAARSGSRKLVRPHQFSKLTVDVPKGSRSDWCFTPSGKMNADLEIVSSDCVVNAAEPHLWVRNSGNSSVRIDRHEVLGHMRLSVK